MKYLGTLEDMMTLGKPGYHALAVTKPTGGSENKDKTTDESRG